MENSPEFINYAQDLISKINTDLIYAEKRCSQEGQCNPSEALFYSRSIITLQQLRDATFTVIATPNLLDADKYVCLSSIISTYATKQVDDDIKNKLKNISKLVKEKRAVKDLTSLL